MRAGTQRALECKQLRRVVRRRLPRQGCLLPKRSVEMKIHALFKLILPILGAVAGLASVLTGCGGSHNGFGSQQSYDCSFTMPAFSTAEQVQQAIEAVNQDHSSLTCPDGMPT